MRFSDAAALISIASLAQAAPAAENQARDYSTAAYQSGIFYTNWAIYGRKHFITDLPASHFTKINYAFANVNNVTGEVFLSDSYADVEFVYPGDVVTNGSQLLGNFNQLYKLKQKNRGLKVVLSVGGWSYRANFKPALATAEGRKKFCDSSLQLIADLALDGFDIDWEYPSDATDAANLLDTVKRCRKTYDEYAALYANNFHFDLGYSSPAGPERYTVLPISELDPYIDNWNLMAFDYQGGGFSNYTGHLSNVYASKDNPKSTDGWQSTTQSFVPFNTKDAIDYYKARVKDSRKIHLGMPLYGRSFGNVVSVDESKHGMGANFNGSGSGTWEPGTLDYNKLPLNGSTLYTDKSLVASWTWDKVKKEVVSYDTPEVAKWKVDYIKSQKLGGGWWWESSGDKKIGDKDSLINLVVGEFGGTQSLKKIENNLYYPKSKYYNIRNAAVNKTSNAW